MSLVDFEDLQALSGYKQVNKVVDWCRERKLKFVIGGDGKPRTFDDYLREAIDGEERKVTPVRFG
jgi:hypothetical protein